VNNISNPEDYKPLQYRISKKVLQKGVGEEMINLFQNSFNEVISEEKLILSKNEQIQLMKVVLEEVIIDIRKEL
jgi:hypothetical protein